VRSSMFSWSLRLLVPLLALSLLLTAACTQVPTENITGLLQAIEGQEMLVTLDDGTTLRIVVEDEDQNTARNLVGKQIEVKVRTEDSKRRLIEVEQQGEEEHLTGIIESKGASTWVIGGQEFKVNATTQLDGGLTVGAEAKVEFVRLPDGSLLATEIETDKDEGHFSGTVQSIGTDTWKINGETFTLDDSTRIDDDLAVGLEARVEFVTVADGSLLAIDIQSAENEDTDSGDDEYIEDHYFAGIIESIGENTWAIGGGIFKVNNATELGGDLAMGMEAKVEYIILSDSTYVATEIEGCVDEDIDDSDKDDHLTGLIGSIGSDSWEIDGKSFKVNSATEIEEGLTDGVQVMVKFIRLSDGSLLATEIEMLEDDDSVEDSDDDQGSDDNIEDEEEDNGSDSSDEDNGENDSDDDS
jgi:hypothetical protein